VSSCREKYCDCCFRSAPRSASTGSFARHSERQVGGLGIKRDVADTAAPPVCPVPGLASTQEDAPTQARCMPLTVSAFAIAGGDTETAAAATGAFHAKQQRRCWKAPSAPSACDRECRSCLDQCRQPGARLPLLVQSGSGDLVRAREGDTDGFRSVCSKL
jgi:hypothetical protein